jgi:hypothetical protein
VPYPNGTQPVKSALSPANGSQYYDMFNNYADYLVQNPTAYTVKGKKGSSTYYGIKFEVVGSTGIKNSGQCDEFEYVLAGNQVGKQIDIFIKAGTKTSSGSYIPSGCKDPAPPGSIPNSLTLNQNTTINRVVNAPTNLNSRVFPNPHDGKFNVQFTAIADGAATVEVYTMDGKRVQQKALQVRKGTQQSVPFTVPGKSSLIYRVINGDQSSSGRILPN